MDIKQIILNLSIDEYLLAIIKNNLITITAAGGVLKGLAVIYPHSTDNKIISMLLLVIKSIKSAMPGKK